MKLINLFFLCMLIGAVVGCALDKDCIYSECVGGDSSVGGYLLYRMLWLVRGHTSEQQTIDVMGPNGYYTVSTDGHSR
jgi:hypothetical protein